MQPNMKVGDKVGVTLTFDDGAALLLMVPVYGPGGPASQ
jgi:copper(I)-binding protein